MEIDFDAAGGGTGKKGFRNAFGRGRVLLREPERCPECNRVYLGLYPLKRCDDHEGLDEL
ncbi:MAG: hypothetical protein HY894_07855 [Deltaproteobacteria bacterium]|nr:hypothetical protein [Deltaproteobacteria bacterium]